MIAEQPVARVAHPHGDARPIGASVALSVNSMIAHACAGAARPFQVVANIDCGCSAHRGLDPLPIPIVHKRHRSAPAHPGQVVLGVPSPGLRASSGQCVCRRADVSAGHVSKFASGKRGVIGIGVVRKRSHGMLVVCIPVGVAHPGLDRQIARLAVVRISLAVITAAAPTCCAAQDAIGVVVGEDLRLRPGLVVANLQDVAHRIIPGSPVAGVVVAQVLLGRWVGDGAGRFSILMSELIQNLL